MCAETQQTGVTQVVELTPPGRAAVAVLLVDGPEALDAVGACFTPARGVALADVKPGRIVVGRWGGAHGEELVVCRRSNTRIEVHCHGGGAAVRAVVRALVGQGCRPARWQDWLQSDDADPIRTAARLALAEAPTARAAGVLVDQYHGALAAALRRARDAVQAGRWRETAEVIDAMLHWAELGRHLIAPWRVVLAGPTNVGKSSLLNALAGYQRAIVCELPGTTRDVVTISTAIDGWPVQLADTAGRGPAGDELEAAAARRAAAAVAGADLVVVVHDAAKLHDLELGGRFVPPQSPPARTLHVLNKIDLIADRGGLAPWLEADSAETVLTSALTGDGVPGLVAAIGRTLVPAAPVAGAAVPFSDEQIASLDSARAGVERQDPTTAAAALGVWLAE
jgi:tRNA modification GTPase